MDRLIMSFDGKTYQPGIFLNDGTRVKIRDRIIHGNSKKYPVHTNVFKVRYKKIWGEGGDRHSKIV